MSLLSVPILDSHVHFWDAAAAHADVHPWMSSTPQLAGRQYSVPEYLADHKLPNNDECIEDQSRQRAESPPTAERRSNTHGNWVTTRPPSPRRDRDIDRATLKKRANAFAAAKRGWPMPARSADAYDERTPPSPSSRPDEVAAAPNVGSRAWSGCIYVETDRAQTVLFQTNEIQWVNELATRYPQTLKGIVLWAPMDQGKGVLRNYVELIKRDFPAVWSKLCGFRFLLQGITDEVTFEELVLGQEFLDNLHEMCQFGKHLAFDVGVDQRSGGTWQLRVLANMAHMLAASPRAWPVLVLNHFCKPDLMSGEAFDQWKECMTELRRHTNVYIKLSGLFSESHELLVECDVSAIATTVEPWFDTALQLFGHERCMFGSDWPICTLRAANAGSAWLKWVNVVQETLDRLGIGESAREWIWWRTANAAYDLGLQ